MKIRFAQTLLLLIILLPLAASAYPPYGPATSTQGPSLGVMVKEIPFPELGRLGLDHGVRVVQVMPGSPAALGGLQPGDILQTLNGKPVYSASRLRWLVLQAGAGAPVSLDYLRGKERVQAQLNLNGSQPPSPAPLQPPQAPATGEAFLGVHLQAMTPQLREAFGAPQGSGVLIAKIVDGSPAQQAGLSAGDIIVHIGGEPVQGTQDIYRVLDGLAPGDEVKIELIRATESQSITATLGERQSEPAPKWWRRSENPRDMRDFLPPPEYWRQLMDHMMQSLEQSMDELRESWPEKERQETY